MSCCVVILVVVVVIRPVRDVPIGVNVDFEATALALYGVLTESYESKLSEINVNLVQVVHRYCVRIVKSHR